MSQRSQIDRMRVVLTCSVVVLFLSLPGRANANAVIEWNATALSSAFAGGLDNLTFGCNDALHESRMMAMMHVAIHDALNAIDNGTQPYAFDGHAPGASPDAAVAAAAHDVLVATYPRMPGAIGLTPDAAISLVEAAYATALAAIPDGSAKTEGILIGRAAAAAIVALRAHDNAELPFIVEGYVPGPNPGDFQSIPGSGSVVAAPYWGQVTPFVLGSSSQYQPKAPYAVSSKNYAADFNEVKSLGAKDSTTRTQDQTEIAYFWVEGAPQGWNRIARTVAVERGLDQWETARLFGLLTGVGGHLHRGFLQRGPFTSSGARLPRCARARSTATRILSETRTGCRRWRLALCPSTPRGTADKAARCQRCWLGSSVTGSAPPLPRPWRPKQRVSFRASPRQRWKTVTPASTSDSISGTPSPRGLNLAPKWAK